MRCKFCQRSVQNLRLRALWIARPDFFVVSECRCHDAALSDESLRAKFTAMTTDRLFVELQKLRGLHTLQSV